MKKIIFLLLAMAVVTGAVFAAAGFTHPPWAYGPEMTTVFECVVNDGVVTQPADLATSTLFGEVWQTSIQAVLAHDNILATAPQLGDIMVMPSMLVVNYGKALTDVATEADYYLRC